MVAEHLYVTMPVPSLIREIATAITVETLSRADKYRINEHDGIAVCREELILLAM